MDSIFFIFTQSLDILHDKLRDALSKVKLGIV